MHGLNCTPSVVKPRNRPMRSPMPARAGRGRQGSAAARPADRGAEPIAALGRKGASLDPRKRTHAPELRTTAQGPGSPISATCKGRPGFMVKRKAVVPATLGEDRLDGLRTVLWGSTSRVGSALGSSSERHGGTFPFGKDPAGAISRQV